MLLRLWRSVSQRPVDLVIRIEMEGWFLLLDMQFLPDVQSLTGIVLLYGFFRVCSESGHAISHLIPAILHSRLTTPDIKSGA